MQSTPSFGSAPRPAWILIAGLAAAIIADEAASGPWPLPIQVRDTAGIDLLRPVTGGVPLLEGAAPKGTVFALADAEGRAVPLQTSVLGRWKDGSARWVLLDFLARPSAGGRATFRLDHDPAGGAAVPAAPVRVVEEQGRTILRTKDLALAPVADGILRIGDRDDIRLTLTDESGMRCAGAVDSVKIEAAGPVRGTLALAGAFRRPDGTRVAGFRMRASLFAGLSQVFLEPHLLVDPASGVILEIRALDLEIVSRDAVRRASIGGSPGWDGPPDVPVRLLQIDDTAYRIEGADAAGGAGDKAPGWASWSDGRGSAAVAVREFWQQWPKAVSASDRGISIGLFPAFVAGTFAHMEPWYKHQYLFRENRYRLRTGQSRRWQVWVDLAGEGEALAAQVNAPLVPAVAPERAIATGVWGPIAAAGTRGMAAYDAWAENLFENGYVRSIREGRDYGAMNWGDWWGERGCNWGNHEYDTPAHILVQFARTGDPKYLHLGDTSARHTSEVDVIHFVNDDLRRHFEQEIGGGRDYPVRPGMVHQHCVGHVSGFYPVDRIRALFVSLRVGEGPRPYLCLDPYNLGHIWTQGMVYDYFLTGDPWIRETVEKIGDNLARLVEDREFPFKGHSHSGRVNGWTMLAIAGAYEIDFDDRYLKAMKLLADDALSEQDPETGGWRYRLPAGHCDCEVKHIGEAAFISAIRLNGLARYHELRGDPRVAEALKRGVTHLNRDTWEEKYAGWRYTSCPKSSSGPGRQTGVIVLALVNAVKLAGDPEHLRILRKAWDAKFEGLRVAPRYQPGIGKTYSTIVLGCPEAMNLFVNGLVGEADGDAMASPPVRR